MSKQAILIIALSARPFAQSAKQAGYRVTVIDAFADKQTVAISDTLFTVPSDEHGFKSEALIRTINRLNTHDYQGFVYGSGFEAQPALLQVISEQIPLIGNTAAILSAVKSFGFFETLESLYIPFPPIFEKWPTKISGAFLRKSFGGCGGTHISIASSQSQLGEHQYFQQYIEGQSVSVLFLAYDNGIEIIGCNEQWINATTDQPFRYGGAVNHIDLPLAIRQQLIKAAEALSIKFKLVGLNSLDAVISNQTAYVLEINPRLSATLDLYDANLFDRHLNAVNQRIKEPTGHALDKTIVAKAHAIIYANKDTVLHAAFKWPEWVTDTPVVHSGSITIKPGEPICSVLASAKDAKTAKLLVMARVKILDSVFR